MRSVARLVARPDGRGGTRLTELAGEPPLLLRQTGHRDGVAEVYVVGAAAGPLAGDDLRLEVEVTAGAAVRVHTVAASVALPGRPGAGRSRMLVRARVDAGAALHWLPEQTVAAAGCAHHAESWVESAEGAVLTWRDELVCGRYAERPGDAVVHTHVDHAGAPLLRQSLAVGPSAPGWDGAAVLGGAVATGSLLLVRPGRVAGPPWVRPDGTVARLPLAGGLADLWTATAPDAHLLRELLSPAEADPPGRSG
ncbi:urease accessory protein UreD [Micromonospora sp. SH-82]|uniref:urease accessory protein UreD n=1 Tax=Micromonospora sp. SH-82 TaxID=3132938 RepID=UPI003EBB2119